MSLDAADRWPDQRPDPAIVQSGAESGTRPPLARRTRQFVRTTVTRPDRRRPEVSLTIRPDRRRPQVARAGPRNRANPSLWEAMAVDPNLHVSPESMALQIRNLQRYQRRHLSPVVKAICGVLIRNTLRVKRVLPHSLGSETALNWLAPRFLSHWCSPETVELILRHFAIESNLINFLARNSGADDVQEVDLYPRSAWDVAAHTSADGSTLNAVTRHDANVFNLVIDLGESETADVFTQRPLDDLDFSMLEIPELDVEPGKRRIMNLDLESALDVTMATLVIFMDFRTAERAINSFQLDESMFSALANLTGDPTFRVFNPAKFGNWVGVNGDVGGDLYRHIACNEYAHERLRWMGAEHG
jgi:hypothetical protein